MCSQIAFRAMAIVVAVLLLSGGALAYSVLTHEEIIDLAWTSEIRPLLIERYPGLTEDQIKEAHAYAYGGSVIQDLGISAGLCPPCGEPLEQCPCGISCCIPFGVSEWPCGCSPNMMNEKSLRRKR
jgi:hypothetical protein